MHVLTIDQGTSSTKALVVDPDGRVVGEAVAPVSPHATEDGAAVEQDPTELLDSIVNAGRAAIAAAGNVPVAAIGLANQGETVSHWDRATGRPLGPAVSWQDRRAVGVARELAGDAERLHADQRAAARPLLRRAEDALAAPPRRRATASSPRSTPGSSTG